MRKTSFILSALIAFSACDNSSLEDISNSQQGTSPDGVIMTIPEFVFDDATATRTNLSDTESGMSFVWTNSDKVNVATNSGGSLSKGVFSVKEIGNNAKIAAFDGGGFALSANSVYYAFTPYSGATSNPSMTLTFDEKTQSANGSYLHLNAYDYMIANATTDDEANAVFNFSHLGAIVKFKITVPSTETFTKATFTSLGEKFTKSGTIDYTTATEITPTSQSQDFSLALNNITVNANNELTLYSFVAPLNLAGSEISVKLTSANGLEYSGSVAGKNMQAGNAYGYVVSVEEPSPYITFSSSDNTQTFMLSKATTDTSLDGKLQYSVGGSSWTTLTIGQAVAFGGDKGDLRLRGKSSVGTNGFSVKFGQSTPVACSGDIRTLVDYTNYEATDCSKAVFRSLFSGCTQLTSAPELPITTLAEHCYESMFEGCTSLATAPALPAMELSNSCYASMFKNCTSLKSTPDLPATSLAEYCYYSMFRSCSQLINVPSSLPAQTLYNRCYQHMFSYCTALVTAPNIEATKIDNGQYHLANMFTKCTSLTKAPDELKIECLYSDINDSRSEFIYYDMFSLCSSLTKAPIFSAKKCGLEWFQGVFASCTKLSYVTVLADNFFMDIHDMAEDWLLNVSPTGTLVISINNRYYDPDTFVYGPSTVPEGWTIKFESPAGIITDMEGDGDW